MMSKGLLLSIFVFFSLCYIPTEIRGTEQPGDSARVNSPSYLNREDGLVKKIEDAYKDIFDIKGRFKQKSYLKDLERTEVYEGEFYIKIPSRFRWSYRGKAPQEIIISKDTIIIYQKKEKQALKGRFSASRYGQAPIALLGGLARVSEDFDTKEEGERLFLKPKYSMGNIKSIEVYTSNTSFPVRSIKITDSAMNIIEIQFEDVVINSGLSDRLFEFIPPEGVKVIEGLY